MFANYEKYFSFTAMKTLYLLRHAKSSWKNPELADFERPLNRRGKKDAPAMGKFLKFQKVQIDLIVCSPAKRTRKTAKKVAKEIFYPKQKILYKKEIYEANIADLFSVVQETPNEIHSLMLVGHNPSLNDFANLLLPENPIENIPTAGIVAISFAVNSWQEIEENTGKLLFFEYPKKLFPNTKQNQVLSSENYL
ncbi:phosphohistidine phosphatase SixA [Raineya orbicola]|uniref:SixA: phosphohistidine phosphatase SixA n=1 Tax=Raineya orbicola TaxID=2016530 RepID=A0A2N3IJ79_9BACT|nr:phosphohistidine phosphatase SixA [Raineya orbicola]PKQ70374.1 sixA: phosphohistidine phosphatase SixA [Raineya orbicola]